MDSQNQSASFTDMDAESTEKLSCDDRSDCSKLFWNATEDQEDANVRLWG